MRCHSYKRDCDQVVRLSVTPVLPRDYCMGVELGCQADLCVDFLKNAGCNHLAVIAYAGSKV